MAAADGDGGGEICVMRVLICGVMGFKVLEGEGGAPKSNPISLFLTEQDCKNPPDHIFIL